MAMKDTEEQLNQFDKATLIQLFLATQEQLESIDAKLQLVSWILGNMTMNSHHRSLKALDFTDIFAIYT